MAAVDASVGAVKAAASRVPLLLATLVAASTVVRAGLGLLRPTPLYYPDEYFYTAMARSIASTGLPTVREQIPHFPALLTPYLMAPVWLIHNVDIAYRVGLGWGSLWFSLAAIPAYRLARLVGVSDRGSLLVALLALLLPDAVFTTDLLSEPFAYPVFLATVLLSVKTLTSPTGRKQVGLVAAFLALCLLRFEFVVVPAAYMIAALAVSHWSPRRLLRRQAVVLTGIGAVAAASLAVGTNRLIGYYTGGHLGYAFRWSLLRWFGLDLFVLLIAAGWVVVPGAVLGLHHLRARNPRGAAFTALTVPLVAGFVAVAASYGPRQGRVYERYLFYVVPLVLIAFVWATESLPRTRWHAALAYGGAGVALLVPAFSELHAAGSDMSPTLLGLTSLAGGRASSVVWPLLLAGAAVVVGLRVGTRRLEWVVVTVLMATIGAAGTKAQLAYGSVLGEQLHMTTGIPRLGAAPNAALITSPFNNGFALMKTLFWNPNVTHVLVMGDVAAPDGFPATTVRLVPGKGFVDSSGRSVPGPFAFDTDTFAAEVGESGSATFQRAPELIAFGWNRLDHYLETVTSLYAVASTQPLAIRIGLVSPGRPKAMGLVCGRVKKVIVVGRHSTEVRLRVPARAVLRCRIGLLKGAPVAYHRRLVSVQAFLQAFRADGRAVRSGSAA